MEWQVMATSLLDCRTLFRENSTKPMGNPTASSEIRTLWLDNTTKSLEISIKSKEIRISVSAMATMPTETTTNSMATLTSLLEILIYSEETRT